jgi:hypothetical protein
MFVSSFLIVFVVLSVAWVRRVCIPPPWRSDSPSPARRAHFFGRPLRAGASIDPTHRAACSTLSRVKTRRQLNDPAGLAR